MDQQIGQSYQTRVGVTQLASMPALPNCHTYSSLLSKDYGTVSHVPTNNYIESCSSNDLITRKRSFYILSALLVIGIAILIFIGVGGIIAYMQYTQQLSLRPTIDNKICERTYCSFGAQCIVDQHIQQPLCRCDDTCFDNHQPVCGSDGHNYINECQLKLTACTQQTLIYVKSKGKCGINLCETIKCQKPNRCKIDEKGSPICKCSNESCPNTYNPVCGSDGFTYDSECDVHRQECLQNKIIAIKHTGSCLPTNSNTFQSCLQYKCPDNSECVVRGDQPFCDCVKCSEEVRPVCGTDHITYLNECLLKRQSCLSETNIKMSHFGRCEGCHRINCSYYSECKLNDKNEANCVCPQVCIRVDRPVCGTNGITYENECELKVAACRLQTHIELKLNASCDLCHGVNCKQGAKCENGQCVCPTECPSDVFEPLCANDGNTYNNDCEMKRTGCQNQLELIALFYGECEEKDETDNNLETGSGFGTNKINNQNVNSIDINSGPYMSAGMNPNPLNRFTCEAMNCQFGAKCKYNIEGIPFCECQFDCLTKIKENQTIKVCGTDGRIYESECHLSEESCRRQIGIYKRDKHMCNGYSLDMMPCNGQPALLDISTGEDMRCEFGDNDCPLDSFCRKRETFGVCCPHSNQYPTDESVNCDSTQSDCFQEKHHKINTEIEDCRQCNKHGSYKVNHQLCNPLTKQCNCKSGVGGLHCDRCEAGFWGLHKISEGNPGCILCDCNKFGSVRDDCEQMTGRCVCKHGIKGMKCDVCPTGSVLRSEGCTDLSIALPVLALCRDHQCFYGAVCKQKENHSLCVCDFECDNDEHQPIAQTVCASDGSTHISECHLKQYSCRFQKAMAIIHENSCTDEDLIEIKKKKRSLPKSGYKYEQMVVWKNAKLNSRPISLLADHQITHFDGNNFLKYFVRPTSITSPFMLANKMSLELWFLSSVMNGVIFYYSNSYKIGYTTLYWSLNLRLVNGFTEMKVDIVSIMTRRSKICDETVTSGQSIQLFQWNHLTAEINLDLDTITIHLNSGPVISKREIVLQCFGRKPSSFENIKAIGAFYIGGAPLLKAKNFVGAIKQFSINGYEIR